MCTGAGIQRHVAQGYKRPFSALHHWLRNRTESTGFSHLHLLLYCCHPLPGLSTLTLQETDRHVLSKYSSNTCEPSTVVGTSGGPKTDSALEESLLGSNVSKVRGIQVSGMFALVKPVEADEWKPHPTKQCHIVFIQMKHQEEGLFLM